MDTAEQDRPAKVGANGALFPATHWTEIAAIRANQHPESAAALENLCRTYLPAIENYMRWFRRLPGDPHELANEFLAQFIHQDSLNRVDRTKGKFRNYVAGAIRYFLQNKWRGIANSPAYVEFDESFAAASSHTNFDGEFDRSFAHILVGNAIARTVERFAGSRIEAQIPILLPYLGTDPPEETLRDVAQRLGITDDLIYQNLKRVRRELFRQLRSETRRHLGPDDDVIEEMQALLRAYARG